MIIEPTINPIRVVRTKYGLTQHKMAELTGIPFRTIQNWEGGQRKCPDYVVDMVVDKLDRTFGQPDYKTILEEILAMLENDLKHLKTAEAQKYVTNVISDIKDALK